MSVEWLFFGRMRILLIDNHDSFTYNLVQSIKASGFNRLDVIKNDALTQDLGTAYDAIVISPGPGLPETAGELMPFLTEWVGKKPILGVCLGHQALGVILGGRLRQLNHILHGEISEMTQLQRDPLFTDIPQKFPAGRYHSWVLDEKTLPTELIPLCQDPDGHIMAFRHVSQPTYGIQFHPESYMTPVGERLIHNWLGFAARNKNGESGLEIEC